MRYHLSALVTFFSCSTVAILIAAPPVAKRPRAPISADRELKKIDLTRWDCRDRDEGNAKTPDDAERNRLKNRSATSLTGRNLQAFETTSYLRRFAAFERRFKNSRRRELTHAQKQQLHPLEKELVSLSGYLVLAYAGPPEATNCGSRDFHDWHLELFEKPLDHPPRIGDPTPIICEITPRTQNAIFRENFRVRAAAGFIRGPDMKIESTGHAARKVRVTGYLLWDDEHNGTADIGKMIRDFDATGYHHPWRSTAWEIHPVIKIEIVDAIGAQ